MFFRIQIGSTTWRVTARDAACWRSFLSWIFALFGLQPARNSVQQIWRGFKQWALVITSTTEGDKASSLFFFSPATFKVNIETLSEKKGGAHCFSFILYFFTVKMFRRSSERTEDCQEETGEANRGNWGKCKSVCFLHACFVRFKPLLHSEKSVQTEAYLMHSAKVSWELYYTWW